MSYFVLVRHGESRWNLAKKFTGWADVPLSENGIREAERCAAHCSEYDFDAAFTSNLERAHSTLIAILSRQSRTGIFQHEGEGKYYQWKKESNKRRSDDIPIFESEALNERYYGKLQGLNKLDAEGIFGKEDVLRWRRGYADRPPGGESLKDAFGRIHPYYKKRIEPRIKRGESILLAGHGNTLRAIIKYLEKISDDDIAFVDLIEGMPLVYEYRRGAFKRIKGGYKFDRPLR